MRTGECFQVTRCLTPQLGLGVGGTFNLKSHFAFDSEFNVLPRSVVEDGYATNGSLDGGRASEFLAGVRSEARTKRYGFFLDAQPGLVSWSEVPTGLDVVRSPDGTPISATVTHARRTFFASKVGVGFEYSPADRIHVRFDVGDLLIRYGHSDPYGYCDHCVVWTNNPQVTVGVYAGFGKPIQWQPPKYNPTIVHRFWGSSNLGLMGAGLLGLAADGITTQRFIGHGKIEGDPFARPLVKYGWSGQVTESGLEATGVVLSMYGLHRMHQHWVERLLPVSIGAAHGVLAYNNTKFSSRAAANPKAP